jgi:hypothetical protein
MMSPRPTSRARMRALFLLAISAGLLVAVDVSPTWAASGGRVYNPKALRPKKEPVPSGRTMRRPNPQIKDGQPLKRSYAVIPDPEPQRRGGSKYVRKGRYFYEVPRPITMNRRSWTTRNYSAVVPDPTHWSRRVNSRTTK